MPEPRWRDVGGVRTCYYEIGAGAPVVFIYGGNFGTADSASTAFTWNLNLRALAASCRAVAFDKIGQGFTDNPPGDDYTMAAVVRHAASFIETLGPEPVHLVGHSRGGFAAMRLTLEHQHLIRSLTIVNSGTLSPGVGTNDVVLSRPPYPPYTRDCARWVYANYCHRPEAASDDWIEAVYEVLSLPKYRESVRKMEEEGLKTRLFLPQLAVMKGETLSWLAEGRLQRPTQIIWGFNDRTSAVEGGLELFRRLAARNRQTAFHVINEAGHFPFREHPARFNALLARFVALNAG